MDLTVKFKPRKINLEPRDIFQISNLVDGEVVHDPRGKHLPGAPFVINHGDVGSKKFPSIIFPAPNPVEFYLFSALQSLEAIPSLEEEVKKDPKRINALLLEEFRFCIFAVGSLEAFINQMIPPTFIYTDKEVTVSKEEIERWWSLEDKFKKVIPQIAEIRIASDARRWGVITQLIGLRNDLMHLKACLQVSDFRSYQDLYRRLLDNDYLESYSVIKDTISSIATSVTVGS